MSTLIRTGQVPAADRFGFVREMIGTMWVPIECRSEYQADYRGGSRASGLGAMLVVVMDIMPAAVRRTPKLISSAGDFSRAFRAAHGLPPAECRRLARVVKASARQPNDSLDHSADP